MSLNGTKKGFMTLNDDLLELLDGKIEEVDLQLGCRSGCVFCAEDAPGLSKRMEWSDLMTISDSILEVSAVKNMSLLTKRLAKSTDTRAKIYIFSASDPVWYRSFDGKYERTIYDATKRFMQAHNRGVHITTSGWPTSNNYMQKALERMISEGMLNNSDMTDFVYSIKTVAISTISEYAKFKMQSNDSDDAISNFITESNFSKQLIANLKTLAKTKASYSKQYLDLDDVDYELFPDKLKSIEELFSKSTIENLFLHAAMKAKEEYRDAEFKFGTFLNKDVRRDLIKLFYFFAPKQIFSWGKEDPYLLWYVPFGGLGRAIKNGLRLSDQLIDAKDKLEGYLNGKIEDTMNYWAGISYEGNIYIRMGISSSCLAYIAPSKDEFLRMADAYKNIPEQSKIYKGLAALQGKNILRT